MTSNIREVARDAGVVCYGASTGVT
eukprot:COSAG06_NODE_46163_length_349_cov_0.616000_1_plen_24_part_10